MIITIDGLNITVDGVDAGTVESALATYPQYTNELWAAANTQISRLTDSNRLLIASAMNRPPLPVRPTPTPPDPRVITNTQFKALFTPEQLVQVWRLSLTDDAVALLLFDVFTRTTINLDDPKTQQGLSYLVSVGVALDLALF